MHRSTVYRGHTVTPHIDGPLRRHLAITKGSKMLKKIKYLHSPLEERGTSQEKLIAKGTNDAAYTRAIKEAADWIDNSLLNKK